MVILGENPPQYKHKNKVGAQLMNPCKGCEYRQIFTGEEYEGKIVFCRKFNCDRDDAQSKCERWKGVVDPSA